ncbi:MAG: hypothetical protein JJU46_12065 [Balneolaceae bacterium]|nr:hypothetical protein [Balneolaceae bacterium]MCH8548109.1 hypothetical protein [Balneolaceae bacterium]
MLKSGLILTLVLLLTGCASARQLQAEAEILTPAGSSLEGIEAHEVDEPQNFRSEDVVLYLPFPANMGVIRAGEEELKTLIMAPAITAGSQIDIIPLALFLLTDSGAEEKILLSVPADPSIQVIKSPTLEQLNSNYPGVIDILTIWLTNHKGGGLVTVNSVADEREAAAYLREFLRE